jgi:hypothetical protein
VLVIGTVLVDERGAGDEGRRVRHAELTRETRERRQATRKCWVAMSAQSSQVLVDMGISFSARIVIHSSGITDLHWVRIYRVGWKSRDSHSLIAEALSGSIDGR